MLICVWCPTGRSALTRLQHSSGFKKDEEEANKEAEAKLAEIKDAGSKKGDKVVEDLIHATVNVNPEAPEKIVSKS